MEAVKRATSSQYVVECIVQGRDFHLHFNFEQTMEIIVQYWDHFLTHIAKIGYWRQKGHGPRFFGSCKKLTFDLPNIIRAFISCENFTLSTREVLVGLIARVG